MNFPHVSVVIPAYKRAAMTCDCVDSVLANDWPALDVIVCDDASPDNTGELVAERFGADPRVKYLRSETNRQVAATRNMGLAAAAGSEFVLFLDCDNIAAPDMVSRLVAAFGRDPALGLAAPLSIQSRGKGELVWGLGFGYDFRTSKPRNLRENEAFAAFNASPEAAREDAAFSTSYSPNAMMVSRAAIDKVGGFDEAFGFMYEEADYGYRIRAAGFAAAIIPAARTTHLGFTGDFEDPPLRRLGIETVSRTYLFARNRFRFMRRWAPRRNLPLFVLAFAHAFAAYYTFTALRNRRPDIAAAYLRGHFRGLFGFN